jgi:3-oxoacyl-(acyl-carrier-protein) synthase
VVVTGRGVVSPLGVGVADHWRGLAEGASGGLATRLASRGEGRGAGVPAAALAPALGRLPRKQLKLASRPATLALLASALALEEAGLGPGAGAPEGFGVVLGVDVLSWDIEAMARYLAAAERDGELDLPRAHAYCMRHINPLDYSIRTLPNLAAGHVAIAGDARGLCRALIEGNPGGLEAIGQARHLVAEGELDVALAGGTDCRLEELTHAVYAGTGLLEGAVPGEGCGVLCLEPVARAEARGARVLGEILGFAGVAGDGTVAPEQEPEALTRRLAAAVEAALAEAGGPPDLIALHGDGLPPHEEAEARALARVLGPGGARVPRLRLKALHGDLGAASPAVEAIACLVALERGSLPDGREVPRGGRALVLALGFFGEAAALVVAGPPA